MKSNQVIAFLLGAVVALGSAVVTMMFTQQPTPVHATEAGAGDVFGMLGTAYQQQGRDTLFLVDATGRRLAIYEYKNERLRLAAVRNIRWDFKYEEFPGKTQTPSVSKVRKQILAAEKSKGRGK